MCIRDSSKIMEEIKTKIPEENEDEKTIILLINNSIKQSKSKLDDLESDYSAKDKELKYEEKAKDKFKDKKKKGLLKSDSEINKICKKNIMDIEINHDKHRKYFRGLFEVLNSNINKKPGEKMTEIMNLNLLGFENCVPRGRRCFLYSGYWTDAVSYTHLTLPTTPYV